MSSGNIVEIIGAVVDAQFPRAAVPKVYDALKVENGLTLEVQQQIGDGVVRTIAMGSTDGLKRGVGSTTPGRRSRCRSARRPWGRIMDVLGTPVDGGGEVGAGEHWPIHRKAPAYVDQAAGIEILETGIKVIDLICPFNKGGKIGLFGGAGVGKTGRPDGAHPQHRHRALRLLGVRRGGGAHPRGQRLLPRDDRFGRASTRWRWCTAR